MLFACLLSLAMTQGRVQNPPLDSPTLRQIVGRPTGENGYEEFIVAGDMIAKDRAYEASQEVDVLTLKQKRAIVVANRKALELFRAGLTKPVRQPRAGIDFDTLLPEFSKFRSIAKVVAMEEYVSLADGQCAKALGAFRDAHLLGHRIQLDALIGGLVGISLQAIAAEPIKRHLDQLDYANCNQLLKICQELIVLDDPLPIVLEGEAKFTRSSLEPSDKHNPADWFLPLDDESDEDEDLKALIKQLSDPALREQIMREALPIYDAYIAQLRVEFAKPTWERKIPEFNATSGSNPYAAQLVSMLLPVYESVATRYIEVDARLRLLATHAAILAYKWWNDDNLPPNLEVLKVSDVAIDPFTGKSLVYKLSETGYKLYSVGSNKVDDGGSAEDDVFVRKDGSR